MDEKKLEANSPDGEETINRGKTQKFIKRLYKVICDEKVPEIIWNNNGTTVLIPNKELFRQNAMSSISHTKEYTAFLRSLNHYQFIKLKRVEEEADEYIHHNFKKGHEHLLPKIVRTKNTRNSTKKTTKEVRNNTAVDSLILEQQMQFIQGNMTVTNQNLYAVSEEVIELKQKVEEQEKTINGLIEVLSKVFRQGISNENVKPALEGNISDFNGILDERNADKERNFKPIVEISSKYKKPKLGINDQKFNINKEQKAIKSLDFNFENDFNSSSIFSLNERKKDLKKTEKDNTEFMKYGLSTKKDLKTNKMSNSLSNRSFSPSDFEKMNLGSAKFEELFSKRCYKTKNSDSNSFKSIKKDNVDGEKRKKTGNDRVKELESSEYYSMPDFDKKDKKNEDEDEDKDNDLYGNLFF